MRVGHNEEEGKRMTIRRTEDVAWRRIDHETVVVHLTRHRMYALNEPGGQVWEKLAVALEGDRLNQLLDDPAAAAFLVDLAAEGLVESDSPLPEPPVPPPAENDPVPPRIEWREEVRRFAGDCGLVTGSGELCAVIPTNS
jgi:hypothetical protein